eukprot:CCRYP_021161-RA/>CCRYP_021161-RA protein AED:0.47 eAED:0.47 QI:140/1/0.5/1/0/0/2/0/42
MELCAFHAVIHSLQALQVNNNTVKPGFNLIPFSPLNSIVFLP